MDIKIRVGDISDADDVLKIAKSLNDWFSDDGIKYIKQDLDFQKLLIAESGTEAIGFLSFFIYEGIGYLGWIGVYEQYHGSDAGKMLFLKFEKVMRKNKIKLLQVKTVGESIDYPPYERSRNYYKKMG